MNLHPWLENQELALLISINPKKPTKGLLLGTDFRHAVEFSRSGRTATRPSRASSLAACPTVRRIRSPAPGGCSPRPSRARPARREPYTSLRAGAQVGPRRRSSHPADEPSQPQEALDADRQAGVPADLPDGQEHAGHEGGPVVGVVPQGEGLPRGAHEHLLVRNQTGKPDRVHRDALDVGTPGT